MSQNRRNKSEMYVNLNHVEHLKPYNMQYAICNMQEYEKLIYSKKHDRIRSLGTIMGIVYVLSTLWLLKMHLTKIILATFHHVSTARASEEVSAILLAVMRAVTVSSYQTDAVAEPVEQAYHLVTTHTLPHCRRRWTRSITSWVLCKLFTISAILH